MVIQQFHQIIGKIVEKANLIRLSNIPEQSEDIDYVGIFPKSNIEKCEYINLIEILRGITIYSDNDGILYRLPNNTIPVLGKVNLIKICNVPSLYDYGGKKIGYIDYKVSDYMFLKNKYQKSNNFTFIYGEGWEILSLENPKNDVSVYIPNIPLSIDLCLKNE